MWTAISSFLSSIYITTLNFFWSKRDEDNEVVEIVDNTNVNFNNLDSK